MRYHFCAPAQLSGFFPKADEVGLEVSVKPDATHIPSGNNHPEAASHNGKYTSDVLWFGTDTQLSDSYCPIIGPP